MPFVARIAVNYPLVYGLVLALPILANFANLRRALPGIPALGRRGANCAPGASG